MTKQLHLGAIMRPVGIHSAWWRYPGAYADANFNLKHLVRFIRTLERAGFDAFFMADHLAVLNMPIEGLRHSATVTSFEPLTLLSALAMATERIGLIATEQDIAGNVRVVAQMLPDLILNAHENGPTSAHGN